MRVFDSPWVRLSPEIVYRIIKQLLDPITLDALCEATKFTPVLHQVSLQSRWSVVRIGEDGFLTAPHLCARPEHQQPAPDKLVGTVPSPVNEIFWHSLMPAAYVRCLFINFNFRMSNEVYGGLPEDYVPGFGRSEEVTYEDLHHSLHLLLPQLKCLTQLELDGILIQE